MSDQTTNTPDDLFIPVLDKGFVRLVDFLGGDNAVVQGARVSFGQESKGDERDRKLVQYLMKHEHGTPFEMAVFKFHVKAPIFVARQWFRHRMGCLGGDTLLYFDLPSAAARQKRQLHKTNIQKFYELWHHGSQHTTRKHKSLFLERVGAKKFYSVKELAEIVERRAETLRNSIRKGDIVATRRETQNLKQPAFFIRGSAWHEYATRNYVANVPMRERLQKMRLRMCNEATGEIEHTFVTDIWQSGIKSVYRVTLENGYQIKMTEDHRCLTENGWFTLKDAAQLRRGESNSVTWNSSAPAFAVNGIEAYRDATWLAARRSEGLSVAQIAECANASTHTIRKYLAKFSLQYTPHERAQLAALAQRGQRRSYTRAPLSAQALTNIRTARSGAKSNFWKGGISSERQNIARWTREQASRIHARYNFACVICASHLRLHAHHIDPVWHSLESARRVENLITLCQLCHTQLHRQNLELEFRRAVENKSDLRDFWRQYSPQLIPSEKPRPNPPRLLKTFSRVVRIEYIGEEMTYDLEVAGPFHNFVANGFVVHNSYNEISYRYVEVEDEFYVPPELRAQDTKNKQASFAGGFTNEQQASGRALMMDAYMAAYAKYEELLALGVARELARIVLPVSIYTQFYVAYNARSLMNFVRLRSGAGAQFEIKQYAEALNRIFKEKMPWTFEAFEKFILQKDEGANK